MRHRNAAEIFEIRERHHISPHCVSNNSPLKQINPRIIGQASGDSEVYKSVVKKMSGCNKNILRTLGKNWCGFSSSSKCPWIVHKIIRFLINKLLRERKGPRGGCSCPCAQGSVRSSSYVWSRKSYKPCKVSYRFTCSLGFSRRQQSGHH